MSKVYLWAIVLTGLIVPAAFAQEHVLPLSDLHGRIASGSQARAADQAAIDHFFTQPAVRRTLEKAGLDGEQLRQAGSLLNDSEKAQLAARARAAEADLSAGELNSGQTTLLILVIAGFAYLSVLVLAFK